MGLTQERREVVVVRSQALPVPRSRTPYGDDRGVVMVMARCVRSSERGGVCAHRHRGPPMVVRHRLDGMERRRVAEDVADELWKELNGDGCGGESRGSSTGVGTRG